MCQASLCGYLSSSLSGLSLETESGSSLVACFLWPTLTSTARWFCVPSIWHLYIIIRGLVENHSWEGLSGEVLQVHKIISLLKSPQVSTLQNNKFPPSFSSSLFLMCMCVCVCGVVVEVVMRYKWNSWKGEREKDADPEKMKVEWFVLLSFNWISYFKLGHHQAWWCSCLFSLF